MKKILIFLFASLLIFAVSCEKENENTDISNETYIIKQKTSSNINIVNGRLVFDTREGFEATIDHLSKLGDENFANWEKEVSFNSMRALYSEEELNEIGIYDALLATVLNKDAIIQIGENVFKLDLINEEVRVLPVEMFLNLNDFTSKNAEVFSTDDNVLDILDGIETDNFNKGSCPGKKEGYYYWNVSGGNVRYKIVYQKSGIIFSLQAKIKKSFIGGDTSIGLTVKPGCWYKKKGSSTKYTISQYSKFGNYSVLHYRPYNGSRKLKGYYYRVSFFALDNAWGNTFEKTLYINC